MINEQLDCWITSTVTLLTLCSPALFQQNLWRVSYVPLMKDFDPVFPMNFSFQLKNVID